MAERRKVYISIGEWQYKREQSMPYIGYVIGVGYAYLTYSGLSEKYNPDQSQAAYPYFSNSHTSKSHYTQGLLSYFIVSEQHIDTSESSIEESFPPIAETGNGPSLSAKVRTAKWAILNYRIAQDVGEYEFGSNNVSTSTVRFATREGLNETPGWNAEGTERNAFRHALWQGYITNKHGYEIAMQIGNAHEDNPDADISQRHFATLSEADQIADLLNNRIGQEIGKQHQTKTPMNVMALSVLAAFHSNGLYTAQKTGKNTYYIDRTTITDEQYEKLKAIFETLNHLGRTPEEQSDRDRQIEEEKRRIEQERLNRHQQIWGTMK